MYECYLFIYFLCIYLFISDFQILLYIETNGNGLKLLRQLLTIKLILLLIGCS